MAQNAQGINESSPYFKREAEVSIYNSDIFQVNSIPKSSIDLIVTSPPYNLKINYKSTNDNLSYEEYLNFTKKWLTRCYEFAKDDGRLCLNIPIDLSKGGKRLISADIAKIAQSVGWELSLNHYMEQGKHISKNGMGFMVIRSGPQCDFAC